MDENRKYDTGIESYEELLCGKCNQKLRIEPVMLSYLDNGFPVELPCCPVCGMVYVPEELAAGKIFDVEQALEDK